MKDNNTGKSYADLAQKISAECAKHGDRNCHLSCPLFNACIIKRDMDKETVAEFTERWEKGMSAEFAKQFPNLV